MANQANKKFTKAAQIAQEQGYEVPEEEKKKEVKAPEIPKGEIKEKPIESQDSLALKNLSANIAAFKKEHCPDHNCPFFQNGVYDPKNDQCAGCYDDFLIPPTPKPEAQPKPQQTLDAKHKPEYGDFVAFTFERTVSIRQFEPFRVQATYRVGKDDLLSDIIKKSQDFNAAIEEAFRVSPQSSLPQDQDVNHINHPDYSRPQEQAQTQHPMGGPPPAFPAMTYPDADKVSEASEKQIRKCYAVWHQMGEPANLKPSGKWSRKEASDYIDKYDRQGQNQGGDRSFPTPEERGYRTRFY